MINLDKILYTVAQIDLNPNGFLYNRMPQDQVSEFGMDVFSRRIGPYFAWLESRIESGWEQNESVSVDVLKEVRQLSNAMRARFILGVPTAELSNEVLQVIELFNIAADAFQYESEDIEEKV